MNLPKTIEILNDLALTGDIHLEPDDVDAIKLGIAAIDRFLLARSFGDKHTLPLLPGED